MVFQKVHLELTHFWSCFIGLVIFFFFFFLQSRLGVDTLFYKVNKISGLQKGMVNSYCLAKSFGVQGCTCTHGVQFNNWHAVLQNA